MLSSARRGVAGGDEEPAGPAGDNEMGGADVNDDGDDDDEFVDLEMGFGGHGRGRRMERRR